MEIACFKQKAYPVILSHSLLLSTKANAEKRAKECLSRYKKRGQHSYHKIVHDIFVGECGENAVAIMMNNKGVLCTPPQTDVLNVSDKTWNDLILFHPRTHNQIRVSVKTQDINQSKKFGLSWVFQVAINEDPTLYDSNHRMALCLWEETTQTVFVRSGPPMKSVRGLLKPMKIDRFTNKKALYFSDIA